MDDAQARLFNAVGMNHDRALQRVVADLFSDHAELFMQFIDNASFRKWLTDTIFEATYE